MQNTINEHHKEIQRLETELIQKIANRCVEYAGLIGFAMSSIKRIKSMSTDEAVITECQFTLEHLEAEHQKALNS
jgi:hypothetical protein